jgi:GntR family transcriptional repressor for pyruvate dehydrogenase complex
VKPKPRRSPAKPGHPAGAQKLADHLYERILAQITAGHLQEGQRLPAETALARDFKVSRPVVREALSRLRADGIVTSLRGSGSYVRKKPSHAFLSLAPIGSVAELMRCFEFRIALEGEAAALAARRRTAQDLAELDAAHRTLVACVRRGKEGVDADINFHNAIAAATRNSLFQQTLRALSAQVIGGISLARKLSAKASRGRASLVQKEHAEILEAIRGEDPDAARAAMRRHITQSRDRALVDSIEP